MKKKIIALIGVILLATAAVSAYEYVLGGTNLPMYQKYPSFGAFFGLKPYSMTVPEYEYDRYRNEVVSYVEDAEEFIDNAYNDIKRILNEIEDAENNANAAVNEFNRWSRSVTVTEGYGYGF